MEKTRIIENESGSVLVIALIMLVLLTVLGITATSTSNIELQIAGNEREFKRAFFVANAGVEHARATLASALTTSRAIQISQGSSSLDWGFALDGTVTGQAATATQPVVTWLDNVSFSEPALSGYSYTITIWNNEASPTVDTDGVVCVKADVVNLKNNVKASVLVLLLARSTGASTDSYTQYGGDMTKNFNGTDLNTIVDYSKQMGSKTYSNSIKS